MRTAAIVILILAIAAPCMASPPEIETSSRVALTKEQLGKNFDSMRGKTIDRVISAMGLPSEITRDPDGAMQLHYDTKYGQYSVEVRGGKAVAAGPRFWMNTQPSLLSYDRLKGAIGP